MKNININLIIKISGPLINKKEAQDDIDVKASIAKVENELGDSGRILVRESGTEPLIRVIVDAKS